MLPSQHAKRQDRLCQRLEFFFLYSGGAWLSCWSSLEERDAELEQNVHVHEAHILEVAASTAESL